MDEDPCRVCDLASMDFDGSVRPRAFFDRALESNVSDWAGLDRKFVIWLVREGHLTESNLPIKNYAGRGKFFIDSRPHPYGEWRRVGAFHVDTKYNAQSHIWNLLSTLEQIGVTDPHFYLAFRTIVK